jgi:hypothetical protein
MITRLWWKEARLIWPIAAFLAIVSVAVHWLAIYYLGKDARAGGLPILALGWTCLYAFAVASASLAGEQENRTLLLLDALPVERWRLWAAKASFAVGSTLLLGALLVGYASLYTDSFGQLPVGTTRFPIVGGVGLILQALGWGLFWSAACSHALTAAALAVCSAGLVMPLLGIGLNLRIETVGDALAALGLLAATVLGSAFLFIRSGPPNRPLFRVDVRVHQVRAVASYEEARRSRRGRPRTWPRAAWSLAWQTLRELGGLWWKLALVALFLPILLLFWTSGRTGSEPLLLVLFGVGVGILAGVNVLGTEYGARSRPFLAHHAVRPGMIWLVRTVVWLAALVPLWVPSMVAAFFLRPPGPASRDVVGVILALEAALLLGCLAVGLLCGMAIRRGITAGMVALVIVIAGPTILGFPIAMGMVPVWVAVAIPLVILAASWAWSGDWLLGLPGVWKWVKLALLLLGGFATVFGLYVYDRSMTLPTLDPVTSARLFGFTTARARLAPEENAASLYHEAIEDEGLRPNAMERMDVLGEIIKEGWLLKGDAAVLARREQALRLVRQAAARPGCRFVSVETMTEFGAPNPGLENCLTFVPLLAMSARYRMARGDLDGAWDEIAVVFKVARHWSGAVPLIEAHQGQAAERWGLSLALLWAVDARQTPESLARALDSFRKLPEMPSAAETVRAEALIIRNTGALPRDELVEQLLRWRIEPRKVAEASDKLWVDAVTTPWELARARKVFTLLYASKIAEAELPQWRNDEFLRYNFWNGFQTRIGDPSTTISGYELWRLFETTPLAKMTFANVDGFLSTLDRNSVGRLAVLQVLALRLWQVRHDGHLPTKLGELVPSILESLPDDPYNTPGQAFGYVRSSGQFLLPLGDFEPGVPFKSTPMRPVEDSWLLYSIGPDLQDDRAQLNDSSHVAKGDIIFPLPERNPPPRPKGG